VGTGELRAGDADRLLSLIEAAWHDEPGQAMPWALLEGLQRLVPCDAGITFEHQDPAAHVTRLIQQASADGSRSLDRPQPDPPDDPFWRLWPTSMWSWPQRTGDLRAVLHTGDFFPTDRSRRAAPIKQIYPDHEFEMMFWLPAAPGELRQITFIRSSGPPFTERDRQVAALLRPHVQEIWVDAERRRHPVPRLTRREWEILELAASGRSYAEIARYLFVSVGTVRKHMEHVRERLGVHSIAAAAALALPRPAQPPPDSVWADGDGRGVSVD
jgi:DNA-binding CsgD family transcriptional regulator